MGLSLRKTAAALLCALPNPVSAAALAARQQTASPLPPPWITVDAAGSARTVSPVIAVTNGATSTISPPPDQLTRVQTWKMSTQGTATTTATRAPIATATPSGSAGSSGGGVMLKCQNYVGVDSPFCYPYRGSLLDPGTTYYLTWDPTYFGWNLTQELEVQVNYDGSHGFVDEHKIPASVGYYAWKLQAGFLGDRTAMNVTLYLNHQDADGSNSTVRLTGPTVTVTKEQMLIDDGLPKSSDGANGRRAVYIAVPIAVALLVLGLGGFCLWSWRKKGTVPGAAAIGSLKRRSTGAGGGYGERRSRSERAAEQNPPHPRDPAAQRPAGPADQLPDDKLPGIQLTDRDSWSPTSPTSGRNVFQEEIRRQETGRR